MLLESLPTTLAERTHRAFIVGSRRKEDGTVVLYLSRRYVSPTTGVGYRTARVPNELYAEYLAQHPNGAVPHFPVELIFRGTNFVRSINSTAAEGVPADEYLDCAGGHWWPRT